MTKPIPTAPFCYSNNLYLNYNPLPDYIFIRYLVNKYQSKKPHKDPRSFFHDSEPSQRKPFLKWAHTKLMRIWDIPPEKMCRQHLLGEHRELHALWSIIINGKKGYAHHPETMRWRGKLKALYLRHEALIEEMTKRGYKHHTPLDPALATGKTDQDEFVDSYEKQVRLLQERGCKCKI